jgi:hypothetical protein
LVKAFLYSGQKVDPETQEIYWRSLENLPAQAFLNAVTICLEECEFFPAIAKLREVANRKSFSTGALKQIQIDPPMSKEEGVQVLRDLMAKIPDVAARPKVHEGVEIKKDGNFAQFNRNYIVKVLPCIRCGEMFRLPFANGNEAGVLCKDCNRADAKPGSKHRRPAFKIFGG